MNYAQTLIQKCKTAHETDPNSPEAKILDLGYCGLTELPKEAFDCVWIEVLVVSNDYWYWDAKKGKWERIKERNKGERNQLLQRELPEQIKVFQGLKELYWGGVWKVNYGLEKISHLEGLTKLTHLNLGHNQITEIQGLDKLVQLQSLSLHYNQLTESVL